MEVLLVIINSQRAGISQNTKLCVSVMFDGSPPLIKITT